MDFRESIVPHLLRNKVVNIPNHVWSIDITYIQIGRGNMYLTSFKGGAPSTFVFL